MFDTLNVCTAAPGAELGPDAAQKEIVYKRETVRSREPFDSVIHFTICAGTLVEKFDVYRVTGARSICHEFIRVSQKKSHHNSFRRPYH